MVMGEEAFSAVVSAHHDEIFRYLRRAIGPAVKLMLDVNQAWTAGEAVRRTALLRPFDPFWLEEPILADDRQGHVHGRQATGVPIAVGEPMSTRYEFADFMRAGAVDIVQADIIRVGGFTEWLKIATLAESFNLPVAPHFMMDLSIHALCAVPNGLILEDLRGGSLTDLGVLVGNGRASGRITGFWNRLDHAITAITLSSTPTQIIRQRANADRVQANGLELEGNVRVMDGVSLDASTGITSVHFTGNTALNGKRVPQVASYNAAAGVRYGRQPWTASAQLRVTGPQFEDDQNVFPLRRATVFDVFASRTIARSISAFVAVENLFDSIYDVGRTPVLTTGLPRSARVGVRMFFP